MLLDHEIWRMNHDSDLGAPTARRSTRLGKCLLTGTIAYQYQENCSLRNNLGTYCPRASVLVLISGESLPRIMISWFESASANNPELRCVQLLSTVWYMKLTRSWILNKLHLSIHPALWRSSHTRAHKYPSSYTGNMALLCASDAAFGPVVQGCRGNFDFTLKFEKIILSILPSAVFIALSLPRGIFLARKAKVVDGELFKVIKIVCSPCLRTENIQTNVQRRVWR